MRCLQWAPRVGARLMMLGLAACGTPLTDDAANAERSSHSTGDAAGDVVVVAVIDYDLNPYHWDFLASQMPQSRNADPTDDLPLDQDPALWLPGHPGAAAFQSYTALQLSVAEAGADPGAVPANLHSKDLAEWAKIQYSSGSTNDAVNMYWVPGTKVIGHVAFRGALAVAEPTASHLQDAALGPATGPVDTFAASGHGVGAASVSVGNIHGTCPNCVFVMVHGYSEMANEWVANQDWIDLQTNSWGLSTTGGVVRDNIYAGSDTEHQRLAVERGQARFHSAGNGLLNAFVLPPTTLLSSQKGPDWIITVGAIDPNGASMGHHRPVDISSLGARYPSATNGDGTVTAEGNFDGTSNATPVIAGLYGEALYQLRRALDGPSRIQREGVIATGPEGCGLVNPDCAFADGRLTVHELQRDFLQSAERTPQGTNLLSYQISAAPDIPDSENWAELEFLSEGHGSYFGLLAGEAAYAADLQRIVETVMGERLQRADPDREQWMMADSLCRQSLWGGWNHGAFDGANAPEIDADWPVRNWLVRDCPRYLPLVVEALEAYAGLSAVQ